MKDKKNAKIGKIRQEEREREQENIAQNAIVFRDMYLQCPFNQRAA